MNLVARCTQPLHIVSRFSSRTYATSSNSTALRNYRNKMGKKKNAPPESLLLLPQHPSLGDDGTRSESIPKIIDTHTHLLSTFTTYNKTWPNGQFKTIHEFVKGMYQDRGVKAIVDVWCEAPVTHYWREIADSALSEEDRKEKWEGIDYWFAIGMCTGCLHRHVRFWLNVICQVFTRKPVMNLKASTHAYSGGKLS